MKYKQPTLVFGLGLLLLLGVRTAVSEDLLDVRDTPSTPVKIIFDTDMGNDVDDALALAILHNMVDRQKCELLAITLTKCSLKAAQYCKAFNTLYGRPDIPIGLVKDGKEKHDGRYVGRVFDLKNADGTPVFDCPTDFVPEDSIALLRRLLAEAEDNSIVIVQVGFSTNLARLLDTPGDAISPLSGRELAAKKVRLVSAMAGAFTFQNDKYIAHKEYNVVIDIPSAQKLFREWPGEIVVSGFELGVKILARGCTILNDYDDAPRKNFVKQSYLLYREGWGLAQSTWDLTSVLFVVRPEAERDYYSLSERGIVSVRDDGTTFFTPDANGKHRCFICNEAQSVRVEEAFVNLCSE
ncbi:MAG: nucleoside hydrolase [Planctomycetia bacterium]|nr:nucleoside hydrolase [Planctomycetia bacterium]